jgi:hypothetical protein
MGPFKVGVWKFIRGWETFSKFVKYMVGDKSKVSFWHDIWCGNQQLKISYPDLFSIARSKDAWVVDNMQFRDKNINWNVSLTRSIQDWEMDVVFSFLEMYYLRIRQGDVDTQYWSPSRVAFFVWTTALGKILTLGNLINLWWWSSVVCARKLRSSLIIL